MGYHRIPEHQTPVHILAAFLSDTDNGLSLTISRDIDEFLKEKGCATYVICSGYDDDILFYKKTGMNKITVILQQPVSPITLAEIETFLVSHLNEADLRKIGLSGKHPCKSLTARQKHDVPGSFFGHMRWMKHSYYDSISLEFKPAIATNICVFKGVTYKFPYPRITTSYQTTPWLTVNDIFAASTSEDELFISIVRDSVFSRLATHRLPLSVYLNGFHECGCGRVHTGPRGCN